MIKIYLGDLVYDTFKTNYVVPLNIAYLAAYTKSRFEREVDIKLFKYPRHLEEVLKDSPPDILGLSNYSWNERLNHHFFRIARKLNPHVLTVLGGPNIKVELNEIQSYIEANSNFLDYYIMFEGEEPFGGIVENVLSRKKQEKLPNGCAGFINGEFHYVPVGFNKKPKQIDFPSPYLTGMLDSFIKDSNMIPLFETNRGCPFGCVYCTWGIAALSRVCHRPLEVIFEELDYVAQKSAKQLNWIFCDANFGMFERDIKIAKKVREIMDKKGFPYNITLWQSKNSSKINIEVASIIGNKDGYVAIQSADPKVLENAGRGNIKFDHLRNQIDYYKKNNLEVATDILIGLPGESKKSHLDTLLTSFDLGFGRIKAYNIRMLKGSKYDNNEYRKQYGLRTKYRPIFGAYGIYDGQKVFEIDESISATRDITEEELESFKILHWLIWFLWNIKIYKPILRFGQCYGVNPGLVLYKLSSSKHPLLTDVYAKMKEESMAEWFDSSEDMVRFYENDEEFNDMVDNFVKLNFLWIARVLTNFNILTTLFNELLRILKNEIVMSENFSEDSLDKLYDLLNKLFIKDLLQEAFSYNLEYKGEIISYILNDRNLSKKDIVKIEIYWSKKDVDFCNYHLTSNGKRNCSLRNLSRFLELGGINMLTNRIKVV